MYLPLPPPLRNRKPDGSNATAELFGMPLYGEPKGKNGSVVIVDPDLRNPVL
jgi:hypothetical protein